MGSGVGRALGISEETCADLIAAHWERWKVLVPTLACVADPHSLEAWLKHQPRPVSNKVLRGLTELAAQSGHDDTDAALVLAWVLHAGADALSVRLWDIGTGICQQIAALLWIEIRTYGWQKQSWVAANILLRVRRKVLVEAGNEAQVHNHRRTLAVTDPLPPEVMNSLPVELAETPLDELERALEWACDRDIISEFHREILLGLVEAAHVCPVRSRANSRLFGDAVTDLVGQRWGITGRTVRRVAKDAIRALAAAYSSASRDVLSGEGLSQLPVKGEDERQDRDDDLDGSDLARRPAASVPGHAHRQLAHPARGRVSAA